VNCDSPPENQTKKSLSLHDEGTKLSVIIILVAILRYHVSALEQNPKTRMRVARANCGKFPQRMAEEEDEELYLSSFFAFGVQMLRLCVRW